ncbi:hypothetical protein ABZ154_15765 [Streptomyces sp. NPDC006261]|uniref:hypothetical protein n=1 Tax=Streptomyces sp. NPDC006261 TaxID=3156739 RepID=UPI0033BEA073
MSIRPVDLPELRAELATVLAKPEMAWFYEGRAPALSRRLDQHVTPGELQEKEVLGLLCDELFFVAEEMYELAKAAAESLPPFTLLPEDVPSQFGFAYIAPGTHTPAGSLRSIAAVEWWSMGSGVRLNFYCDTEVMLAEMLAAGSATTEQVAAHRSLVGRLSPMSAEALIHFGHDPVEASEEDERFTRTIRAMWLLMQQPLAKISDIEADRATRKRLRRTGREPAAVRVIELRRPQQSGPGDGSREFHHQWIVRGHWRNHWHPKRQVHRPVWIAPHVKGPEGAPMIGGEKVYAWTK